ncbi:hypothetical protein B0O99DRAFT_514337 [Bisporella sp. PMI_857]|nr:hypothetical protein B0O99DRAFT_514337 [Bisporella sp. PMI_857]
MPGAVIVTGAAGGLGFAIAERVWNRPEDYTCLFTVRNRDAANAKPLHDLITTGASNKNASLPEVDLSSLKSVRDFAVDINAKVRSGALPAIRVLILNAAVFTMDGERRFTMDEQGEKGYEMHFVVNFLANFLLTVLLLESIDKDNGRIVYVSSWQHKTVSPIAESKSWDPEELARPTEECAINEGKKRYGISKLCLIMFMHALRKRIDTVNGIRKIRILGVDPGAMIHDSMLSKASISSVEKVALPAFKLYSKLAVRVWPNGMFRSVQKSSGDIERAAFGDDAVVAGKSTDIYLNGSELAESAKVSMDIAKQKRLWDVSLKLAMLDEKTTALG